MANKAMEIQFYKKFDVTDLIEIKIGSLEGFNTKEAISNLPLGTNRKLFEDSLKQLKVRIDFESTFHHGIHLGYGETKTKYFPDFKYNWNEWLKLENQYNHFTSCSKVLFTVYRCGEGGQQVPVGGTTIGIFDQYGAVRQGPYDLKVFPNVEANYKDTMGDVFDPSMPTRKESTHRIKMAELVKSNKWLDRLAVQVISVDDDEKKKESNCIYLHVEFKKFDKDILFWERDWDRLEERRKQPTDPIEKKLFLPYPSESDGYLERYHRDLYTANSTKDSAMNKKPSPDERNLINRVISYPPNKMLTNKDEDLLWLFRYYLCAKKEALAKFIKSIDFNKDNEAKEALELLDKWSPPDALDAIELLGQNFRFHKIRAYAANRLSFATDEQILMCLLQLVQAIKYDDLSNHNMQNSRKPESSSQYQDHTTSIKAGSLQCSDSPIVPRENYWSPLAELLIKRACNNRTLANYLFWYLNAECEDVNASELCNHSENKQKYFYWLTRLQSALKNGSVYAMETSEVLKKQKEYVKWLVDITKKVKKDNSGRIERIDAYKAIFTNQDDNFFGQEGSILHPLDPNITATGIVPSKLTVFKSQTQPCLLSYTTTSSEEYATIFKYGDNLKRDQMIIKMITLMDNLLKLEKHDLKLTPYKVLATGKDHGFVEYIESVSLASILANDGTIQNFLRKHARSESSPYEISSQVMENYVKSCAGYCVLTYILGIGDRHLDNLLLTKQGHLFHIDFSYILGQDPKIFPPHMKLTKEMIEGMGGPNSSHCQDFKKAFYTAFLRLRRHATLILSLFSLALDDDFKKSDSKFKAMEIVENKFFLNMDDDSAVKSIADFMKSSTNSIFPAFIEQMHKITQNFRR